MLKIIILFCAILMRAQAKPTDQADDAKQLAALSDALTTQTDAVEDGYRKDAAIVGYINNFKTVMTEYVKSQYKNLTFAEIDEVKDTIEEFLKKFARDLRDVVDNQTNRPAEITETSEEAEIEKELPKLDDGLSDAQFDEIKEKIRAEFPQITDKSAREIVVRLRTNLLLTREKLDHIIKDSQRAQIEYS